MPYIQKKPSKPYVVGNAKNGGNGGVIIFYRSPATSDDHDRVHAYVMSLYCTHFKRYK